MSIDSSPVLSSIEQHRDEHLRELVEFLKIPSVSADGAFKDEVRRCAEWVRDCCIGAGLEGARLYETEGHPIVYAEWMNAGNDAPTLLIYGHYDVQPPDPVDLWTTPPFEPRVEEGNVYARGSVDDKGQVHLHLKAIQRVLEVEGRLPVNVKVVIEGEEEVGSPNLVPFLRDHSDLLACDAVMISDTPMYDYDMPSVTYGLRGMAYFEVLVQGPSGDLHSGMFGGAVANPINALARLISGMKDEQGRITLPGFYDDVIDVSDEERQQLARLPWDEDSFRKMTGINETTGEEGYSDLERLWARPTLDVCGIWGGYQGEGAKTVLPSKAGAKVSMRLVANQDYRKVGEQLREYVRQNMPEGVTVEVKDLHGGPPALTPTDSVPVRAALGALKQAFETEPFLIRNGGSIPIVADFERILDAPVVLMGFGLPDQNAHAPNEKMNLANYHRGTMAAADFLLRYGVESGQ